MAKKTTTPDKARTRNRTTSASPLGKNNRLRRDHKTQGKKSQVGKIDSRTKVVRLAKAAERRERLGIHGSSKAKIKDLERIRDASPGNTALSQEKRLLEALGRYSLSTFEASRYLDCFDPRARIMGLRNKGHCIGTAWALVETECGRKHRLGIYVLQHGGEPIPTGQRQPSCFTPDLFEDMGV